MKTVVMGKNVKKTYKVVTDMDDRGKLKSKPIIELEDEDIKWEEILSYEGRAQSYTTFLSFSPHGYICLSEDEEVKVEKEKFRADLGDWYQYTDKVLSEKTNLKKCEKELESALKVYNAQKIEANPKAKAYCNLHKLDYAETDYEELMGVIEPVTNPTVTTFTCTAADLLKASTCIPDMKLGTWHI
jgi:desulfoferrodoxin (superoxide reductase-like protein)